MAYLFRGEQRAAIRKAIKVLTKVTFWDDNIPALSARSRLTRTVAFPYPNTSLLSTEVSYLIIFLQAQLAKKAVLQLVPAP